MTSFKYYLPAFLWAALLFYLSSLMSVELPKLGIKFSDLGVHFVAYSVLGYFLAMAFFAPDLKFSRKKMVVAIIVGVLYGASDEFHQMFVPGRMATISDWAADSLGVIFGLFIFAKFPALFRFIDKRILRTA